MNKPKRRSIPVIAVLLASLPAAHAQTDPPAHAAAPGSRPAVIVQGSRAASDNPNIVNAATSRILNGKSAYSCAFIDEYNAFKDDVYQAYMSDFGLENGLSNDVAKASIYAPTGDVSIIQDGSSISGNPGSPLTEGTNCSLADWRFAAGRQQILRNDKSLAQGYEAFDNGDFARARALFTTAWNKVGYEEAGLMLARINLYGLGQPKDGPKAVYWLDQVANGPDDAARNRFRFDPHHPLAMSPKVEAAYTLARIRERGIGVPADPAQARRWYAKAADLGFVPALDILGRGLLAGRGGERDPAKGAAMLKQAGEAGYLPAAYHLGQAYYDGDGVARDYGQAAAWFGAAAKAGMPAAMFAAGRMLDLGKGMPADPARALVYYKEAALKGDRDAQLALGTYFYTGEVVGKDATTARKWFAAAARQGQPDAMFNLGIMLSAGEGGAKDPALAYVWFSLAAKVGYERAAMGVRALGPSLTTADRRLADAILKPSAGR
jgi:TPR repeat protein